MEDNKQETVDNHGIEEVSSSTIVNRHQKLVLQEVSRTRIKELFRYKKLFYSSAFMQDELSMLIGQLIKETMDKETLFLPPSEFLSSEFDGTILIMVGMFSNMQKIILNCFLKKN